MMDYELRLRVYASDEADIARLCEAAGKTEQTYVVTAGASGHLEVDKASFTEADDTIGRLSDALIDYLRDRMGDEAEGVVADIHDEMMGRVIEAVTQ